MYNSGDPFGFRRFGLIAMPAPTPPVVPEPGASAFLGGAVEMSSAVIPSGVEMAIHGQVNTDPAPEAPVQDVVIYDAPVAYEAPVVEVAAVEAAATVVEAVVIDAAPIYPVGNNIDFNKPLTISDLYDDDRIHIDIKILAVLHTHSYPVVIQSTDPDGDEHISQFDTDGDDQSNGLSIRNPEPEPVAPAEPEVFVPRTIYIVLEKEEDGTIRIDDVPYASEALALDGIMGGEVLAIFPVTIFFDTFQVRQLPAMDEVIEGDDDHDDIVETESEAEVEEEGHDEVPVLPEGAVYVNGVVRKPGDKVTTQRSGRGQRFCTVIKTRPDAFKSLYVQADNGHEEPYWARNESVKNY